jgi:hypothetical protein
VKPTSACHGGSIAKRTTPLGVTVWSSTPRVTYSARPVIAHAAIGHSHPKLDIRS